MRRFGGYVFLFVFLSFTDGQDDVRMPPYITKDPQNSVIFRDDSIITLECKGEGAPSVNYEWKKNGVVLNLNANNIKKGTDGTITIDPTTSIDVGYYQCFVRNQFGTALSVTSHLQRAFLESTAGTPAVAPMTVKEGDPFHIQAITKKSFPKATYAWEMAFDAVDKNPLPYTISSRVQIADNGDLYFAYATPEDELSTRIYKCTTYNQYLDIKAGGSYTKVTVTRGTQTPFVPTLAYSSEAVTIGLIGDQVSLRCIFSGNPVPEIAWRGPGNTLPRDRHTYAQSKTELIIRNIAASDGGDYTCTGKNNQGENSQKLQLKVEAKPTFKSPTDRPQNTNATDGEDAVFKCNAEAIPDATVVWLHDGNAIDVNAPPQKFSFTNGGKTLTVRSVCRSCEGESRQSDLTVIQCNASNVHGYAFASGYLNVLAKTQIISSAREDVSVKDNEDRSFDFECDVTFDPSTPPTVRWYRVKEGSEGEEELVYEQLPELALKPVQGKPSKTLSISISPNGTSKWSKYHGEYRCIADNGYSTARKVVVLKVEDYVGPVAAQSSLSDWWWLFLIIALIFILLIIILCCCIYCQRNKGDKYDVDEKERKNGNDPEKELLDGDFKDYKRPEGHTLKGSRGSMGSSVKLNSDEEASLNEYGDDPGKFTEDGSFVGAYSSGTADRKKGRNQ